jgi:hypothetical protein
LVTKATAIITETTKIKLLKTTVTGQFDNQPTKGSAQLIAAHSLLIAGLSGRQAMGAPATSWLAELMQARHACLVRGHAKLAQVALQVMQEASDTHGQLH